MVSKWKIIVHKARGRGPNALENFTGADGILQIHVFDPITRTIFRKGLLFQAKKGRQSDLPTAKDQSVKMERLAENGSAVFLYNTNQQDFMGVASQDLIKDNLAHAKFPLDRLINDHFFECHIGLTNLYFDYYYQQKLILPSDSITIPKNQVNHAEILVKINQ